MQKLPDVCDYWSHCRCSYCSCALYLHVDVGKAISCLQGHIDCIMRITSYVKFCLQIHVTIVCLFLTLLLLRFFFSSMYVKCNTFQINPVFQGEKHQNKNRCSTNLFNLYCISSNFHGKRRHSLKVNKTLCHIFLNHILPV